MQVLRGKLLEALPEAEQPKDSSKIALIGIDRKSLRLECGMECIIRRTEEDANLLLAISSLEERYQTFMDSLQLDFGRKIGPDSEVYVTVKRISKKLSGIVWYKGELPSCNGTMFGVELTEDPGQGTSDGTFRNRRYFTCPPDSGVFVGLDKLTPRDDSISKSSKRAESHQSNIASRIKETVMTSFLKGKNEENCARGDIENQEVKNMLKIGQRVVTFIKNDRLVRGTVRYIGKDRDRNGKLFSIVGLELDTRDGLGTGKLHGRQMFVCKNGFALFVPIEAVIPEKDFDESRVYTRSRRTSEREEQIRKDELLAKSLSYDANSSETLPGCDGERQQAQHSFQEQLREKEEREANLIRQLRQTEEQRDNTRRELESCQEQLRGRDSREANLLDQLREKEQENSQRERTEMEQQLTNFQRQITEKDQERANLVRQLDVMQQQLREMGSG